MKEGKSLLYIVRYPLHENFHLKQKFDGQINAFRSLGYQTYFIGFDKQHFYLIDEKKKEIIGKTHYWIPHYFHTFLYDDLYKISSIVVKKGKYDVVYFRGSVAFRSQFVLAREIKKAESHFIIEYPTYSPQIKEKALSLPRRVFNCYDSIWRKKIQKLPDMYTYFGDEGYTTIHGIPAKRLDNGIDLTLVPTRTPKNNNGEIHILAVSSMCDWHGYDRLIKSLAEYKGDKKIIIDIVGGNDGGCKGKWEELASQLGVKDSVVFHGPLYGEKLDEIFDLCDIGVSSLGMYRKDFVTTSELKLREYIARGLPFVFSANDPALSDLSPNLMLKVSNDDTIPNMEDIVEFAEKQKNNMGVRLQLREYAGKYMTWTAQYESIL